MPANSKLFLDLIQLRSQPLPHRLPKHDELPIPGLTADMREAQEVESLRLAVAAPFTILGRKPAELDQTRFLGMQHQIELQETCPQFRLEPLGVHNREARKATLNTGDLAHSLEPERLHVHTDSRQTSAFQMKKTGAKASPSILVQPVAPKRNTNISCSPRCRPEPRASREGTRPYTCSAAAMTASLLS